MKKIVLSFALSLLTVMSYAQLVKPILWSYKAVRVNKTEAVLYIKAKLEGNWHVYAQNVKSEAMKLKINFLPSKDFSLVGKMVFPTPIKKYDKSLKTDLFYFEKQVTFSQRIKLAKSSTLVKGKVEFMVCNDKSCLPADEITLSIPVK